MASGLGMACNQALPKTPWSPSYHALNYVRAGAACCMNHASTGADFTQTAIGTIAGLPDVNGKT